MTDDIVARLRDQAEFGLLGVPGDHRCVSYGDAADEIERLRADVAQWKIVANRDHALAHTYRAAGIKQEEEIEKLRTALQPFAIAAEKADEKMRENLTLGFGALSGNTISGLGIKFQSLFDARSLLSGGKIND